MVSGSILVAILAPCHTAVTPVQHLSNTWLVPVSHSISLSSTVCHTAVKLYPVQMALRHQIKKSAYFPGEKITRTQMLARVFTN